MSRKEFSGVAGTAFTVELPPPDDRPNPNSVASLGRWNLTLPNQHPFWDRYVLCLCHLRDCAGLSPAIKHRPGVTHEIAVFAIDPDFPESAFQNGGVCVLEPVNYCCQFDSPSDQKAYDIAQAMVQQLVDGQPLAEPSGVTGARDLFDQAVAAMLE